MSRPPTEKDSLLPATNDKRTKAFKKIEEVEDDDEKDEKVCSSFYNWSSDFLLFVSLMSCCYLSISCRAQHCSLLLH